MNSYADTILLVCDDEGLTRDLIAKLYDEGFNVIGPAPTARIALALAAQTAPSMALIARPPTGRRGALELARELMAAWGVRSLLLSDAYEQDEIADAADWTVTGPELARMKRALGADASLAAV